MKPLWNPVRNVAAALSGLLLFSVADADPASDFKSAAEEVVAWQPGDSAAALGAINDAVRTTRAGSPERAALEKALIGILDAELSPEARLFVCQKLWVIGTKDSLPALATLLKTPDTVDVACLALSTHPAPESSAILRKALASINGPAAVSLINTLGQRRDTEATAAIAEATKNPDVAIATAALTALGKFASEAALETLAAFRDRTDALGQAARHATLQAAQELAARGDPKAAPLFDNMFDPTYPPSFRRGAFLGLASLDGDGGRKRILQILHGHDDSLKPVAIAQIAHIPGDDVGAQFAGILPKLDPTAQELLIGALARRGDAGALKGILNAVSSKSPNVRLAAVQALGQLGDASAVSALARTVEKDRANADSALTALRVLSANGVDSALIEATTKASAKARQDLIGILADRGAHAAVPVLLKEADSNDTGVSRAAFRALGRLGTADDVNAMVDALVNIRAEAARANAERAVAQTILTNVPADQQADAVLAAFNAAEESAETVETRRSLLRVLGAVPTDKAFAALKTAMDDNDWQIRDAAVRALTGWPDNRALEPVTHILNTTDNATHRALALRAIVRLIAQDEKLSPEGKVSALRDSLGKARSAQDRKLILGALGNIHHVDSLTLALEHIARPEVQAEARKTVETLAKALAQSHPDASKAALERLRRK